MKKAMRIVFVSLFIAISIANLANAKIILHSTVRDRDDNRTSIYFNFHNRDTDNRSVFPKEHYKYTIYGYDLKYDDKSPAKERMYKLNDFRAHILASLDLISADKKRNVYRFRLSLKQTGLDYYGGALFKHFQQGGFPFDAKIQLYDGSSAVLYLEAGKGKDKYGNSVFINSPNNSFFDLELDSIASTIDLKIKNDLPVIMTETHER